MNDGKIDRLVERHANHVNELDHLGKEHDQDAHPEGKGVVPGALCLKATDQKNMYEYDLDHISFEKKHGQEFPEHPH